MKDFFKANWPWVVGPVLLIGAIGNFVNSALGALLLLFAGLLLLPPVPRLLAEKSSRNFFNHRAFKFGAPIVLVVLSSPIFENAEKTRIIDDFTANQARIISEAQEKIKANDVIGAELLVDRYSHVLPGDEKLKELKVQIASAKARIAKEEEAAKAAAEQKAIAAGEAKARAEKEEQRKAAAEAAANTPIAVSAFCRGNVVGAVSTYVSLMDSGQIGTAVKLLNANGCTWGTAGAGFTRANSEIVRQGQRYVALKRSDEEVYGVTTIDALSDE